MTELIESLPFELPTIELLIFIATAAVAIAAAIMVVFQRNAMYSALFLVANFFCLAVMYLLLGAYFLAVVQIAVYAGAIMVLMLFVIMLLNVARPEPTGTRLAGLKLFGGVVALILLAQVALVAVRSGDVLPEPPPPGTAELTYPLSVADQKLLAEATGPDGTAWTITLTLDGTGTAAAAAVQVMDALEAQGFRVFRSSPPRPEITADRVGDTVRVLALRAEEPGQAGVDLAPTPATPGIKAVKVQPLAGSHTQALAAVLFTRFLLPFEVTSILLLAAILGAVVIARKRGEVSLSRRQTNVVPSGGQQNGAPAAAEATAATSDAPEPPALERKPAALASSPPPAEVPGSVRPTT